MIEGNSITLTISRSVASTSAVTVTIGNSPAFPGGYSIVPTSVSLPANALSVDFVVKTTNNNQSGNVRYTLSGTPSDNSYVVLSGDLTVYPSSTPADRRLQITQGATVIEGNSITLTISRSVASTSAVTVTIGNSPAFPGGYSIVPTSVSLPANALSVDFVVKTTNNNQSGNVRYTLSGTPSDNSYVVLSGDLTVYPSSTPADHIITINKRTVIEGTSVDMTASIPSTTHPDLTFLVSPSPGFPPVYKVKVNGAYVSNINSFSVTIPNGETSTVFTVETADDGITANRSFSLNGNGVVSGYYVVSGNLTVLDKSTPSLITIKLTAATATICGGTPINLNDYIKSISPVRSPDDYERYYRYQSNVMVPISTLVNQAGSYTIYAINPATGEVGTAQLVVSIGQVPTVSVRSQIKYYPPIAVDLTHSSVITSSTNVDHYNYFGSDGVTKLQNPESITSVGIYYIEGVSAQGCKSAMQAVTVTLGGNLSFVMTASSPKLEEGKSELITISLVSSDGSTPDLTRDLSFELGIGLGSVADTSDESISSPVTLLPGRNSVSVTLYALSDQVLERDELLVLDARNFFLGTASASVTILDITSTDPEKKVITIGDGTIYYSDSITITASLPEGVTTAFPITLTLIKGVGSRLDNVPDPTFPKFVTILPLNNSVAFQVSGSSTSDIPAKLILAGEASTTLTDMTVKPGTIMIYNKRIIEFMSVSANGDDIHDYSSIGNIEKYPNNEVDIVDRWGVLVWRGKSYNNQDIAFKGRSNQGNAYDLPNGTYYYVIRFYDERGELNIVKGSLQLKRGPANP